LVKNKGGGVLLTWTQERNSTGRCLQRIRFALFKTSIPCIDKRQTKALHEHYCNLRMLCFLWASHKCSELRKKSRPH
jgi:hypothetical protein